MSSSIAIESDSVDRISNLPEPVLYHILSFLPTKNAVSTSLLSKRWEFLWTNIHNLVLSDETSGSHMITKEEQTNFAKFVNNLLILLNKQCINEFSLEVFEYSEVYDVCTWITAAVARKVKVLNFSVLSVNDTDPPFRLPRCLFTCKTLEVLFLVFRISVNVPKVACFPNLKSLHLVAVIFQSDESIRNLISGCSLLETLFIARNHKFDNVVTFTISSPTLRKLTFISEVYDEGFPTELEYKLEINAPALRFLDLNDNLSTDFSVGNLCSVEEANIKLHIDESMIDYDRYSKDVTKLLQGIYNVKKLSLDGDTIKALSHADATLNFMELSQLTAKVVCCEWKSLSNMFEGFNKLESLSIIKEDHTKSTHVTCWSIPKKVPIWLFSSLKTMSIYGFQGLADELAMVAYILKNGKALRKVTIEARLKLLHLLGPKYEMFRAKYALLQAKYELLQKVSNFPRGCEECEITFS